MTLVEPFTLNTSPVFAELMPLSLEERRVAYASHEWRDRVRVGWQNKQGLVPAGTVMKSWKLQRHPI